MHKFIIIGILSFLTFFGQLQAADAPIPKTYAEALSYAQDKNKRLFIVFKAGYCSYCKKMVKDTFTKNKVQLALKDEQDVCLMYYIDTQMETDVVGQYKVKSIPAYGIIDAEENIIKFGVGYLDEDEFLVWLRAKKTTRLMPRLKLAISERQH